MTVNPTAHITSLYRYPVKGLSPEPLPRVTLRAGETLPADRRYAIENGPSGFDPLAPAWMSKSYFLMLMRNERLAGLQTHFEDDTNRLTIRENGRLAAQGDLETAEGRAAIESFFATNFTRGPRRRSPSGPTREFLPAATLQAAELGSASIGSGASGSSLISANGPRRW